MPELPEVEVVAGGLAGLVGQRLLRAKVGRKPLARGNLRYEREDGGLASLFDRSLLAVGRRGKYIVLQFSSGMACLVHLGMTGSLILTPSSPNAVARDDSDIKFSVPKNHLHIQLDFTDYRLLYYDPRRFGGWELVEGQVLQHPWLSKLGVEPLSAAQLHEISPAVVHYDTEQLSAEYLLSASKRRPKLTMKQMLMDNAIVTGIGNIYATEILFAAGFHPAQSAAALTLQDWQRIVELIREFLLRSIACGGCSIRDYRHSDGSSGHFQDKLAVYGRFNYPCPKCRTRLERMVIDGRSCVYCPLCQAMRTG